jgi:ribosomal protein S18 acetylase RimI-like enzyme
VIFIQNPILVTKVNVQQAAETLTSAFEDFPLFTFLLPEKLKRREKLMVVFEGYIRFGLRYGYVYATSSNFEGTAIWFNYEEMNTSLISYLRCGMFKLLRKLGLKDSLRFVKINDYGLELHERNISESHWYLLLLGVRPHYQGKGYGTLLVDEMFRLTENNKWSYWVDTQKEENVSFFQKFGFELVEVGKIPESDIKHWCMIKKVS